MDARSPCAWLKLDDLHIPMLPDMAARVIALASEPDVSIARLAHLISKDPALTTRMLGFANSAYFSPAQEITTLTQSILMLGIAAVRNVVLTVSFASRMYEARVLGSQGRCYFDHGIGTAYAARVVADRVGASSDEAFLAGLLHDVGKLVILRQAYWHRQRSGTAIAQDELQAVLDDMHTIVGGLTVRHWKLPESLYEPIVCHHDYRQASTHLKEAAVVYLANLLSHRYGLGCEAEQMDVLKDPVCRELGITVQALTSFDAHIPGLFQVARDMVA